MLLYIDIEHPKVLKDKEKRKDHFMRIMDAKLKFEKLSNLPCYVLHFLRIDTLFQKIPQSHALLISGNATDWDEYNFEWFKDLFSLIKEENLPVIGFCGGHQLIAFAYGGKCRAMRRLMKDEKDSNPDFSPGMYKEYGFQKVRLLKDDPLLSGLNKEITVFQYHYWEIKDLPKEFEILASSKECKVQMIRHKDKPIYGTQFHPEAYDEEHLDGMKILQNFFKYVVGYRS